MDDLLEIARRMLPGRASCLRGEVTSIEAIPMEADKPLPMALVIKFSDGSRIDLVCAAPAEVSTAVGTLRWPVPLQSPYRGGLR